MKENVFGIPMDVQKHADIEKETAAGRLTYYIVKRQADMPWHLIPRTVRERITTVTCATCGEKCWLDPKNYILGAVIACVWCAPRNGRRSATREAIADVKDMLRRGE